MNLQLHLLIRITLIAALSLLVIAWFLLYQSHSQAEQNRWQIADSVGKQLQAQLLLHNAGIGRANAFPDFEFWKQAGHQEGICLTYLPADQTLPRSLCNGLKLAKAEWPAAFETAYRWTFNPDTQSQQSITVQGRTYGTLTVSTSAELEIAEAWSKTSSLMTLSAVTVLAVCILVYLTINRALRPAQILVTGLAELQAGRLAYRLPAFELNEWQIIASAINQLAASQQQLLAKLINLQEQERRLLARELHDEYGQCLVAINAVVSSMKQTAETQSPELMADAEHISRITQHMLAGMRNLLGRLRPAEFDELGLVASLNGLVTSWNSRSGDKTRYRLHVVGDSTGLSESCALSLFRIAQECLTNIAKHAAATSVNLTLHIDPLMATLTITDNGIARALPFSSSDGMGLLGMRERVSALNGKLHLTIAEPQGLIVEVLLPIETATLSDNRVG